MGTFLFTLFNVGLVGVSSPGSIITIMMMASAGDQIMILVSILASTAVSFLVASVIVKHSKMDEEEGDRSLREAAKMCIRDRASAVRWQQSVETMAAAGTDTFIEIGPGKTLTGFLKRIDRKLKGYSVETPDDLMSVLEQVKEDRKNGK